MTLSVALCTYNGEKYLRPQLDSILNQSVVPDEIIVCDDISEDATVKILEEYREKYRQIRIFVNPENLGFIKNFEKAISLCTQDIIVICDQDDVWEKEKISTILSYFEENKNSEGVFHDMGLIEGDEVKDSYLNWKNISYQEIQNAIANQQLFGMIINRGSFILGCSLAVRRSALEKYSIRNYPFAHDLYIAQKLSAHNVLGFIPEKLFSYRLHENQVYGLRYKPAPKEPEKLSEKEIFFKEKVWSLLNILQKLKTVAPEINAEKTSYFNTFINNRNQYLKLLGFAEKKLYIAKCIRSNYLFLTWQDLFKL